MTGDDPIRAALTPGLLGEAMSPDVAGLEGLPPPWMAVLDALVCCREHDYPATAADIYVWTTTGAGPVHLLLMRALVGEGATAEEARALDIQSPLGTVVSGGGKFGLVAAFLQKYYGSDGQNQPVDRPLDTATVKARFGLVTVRIGGEDWALYDIGMRMLQPRELARAQGFPDSYILEGSKADQIAGIGNSVVPQVMAALVRANMGGAS